MMAKQRTYSQYAQEAAVLMGEQIKLGRKQRQWTEQNLADRAVAKKHLPHPGFFLYSYYSRSPRPSGSRWLS